MRREEPTDGRCACPRIQGGLQLRGRRRSPGHPPSSARRTAMCRPDVRDVRSGLGGAARPMCGDSTTIRSPTCARMGAPSACCLPASPTSSRLRSGSRRRVAEAVRQAAPAGCSGGSSLHHDGQWHVTCLYRVCATRAAMWEGAIRPCRVPLAWWSMAVRGRCEAPRKGRQEVDPTCTTKGVFTGAGGVRTDEAGILTGEVSVRTIWKNGQAHIAVQYSGAPTGAP